MPSGRSQVVISAELRSRLETARLDLLVLFRALDRMDLTAREIQQKLLRQAFELDVDHAGALWALDHLPAHLSCGLCCGILYRAWERWLRLVARFSKMLPSRAQSTFTNKGACGT